MGALAVGAIAAYHSLIGYDPDWENADALRGAEGALFSPTGSSPEIVFAALLWLVWARAPRVAEGFGQRPLWWVAVPCLAIASGLLLWGHYTGATDLVVLSLSFAFLGGGAWLGGWRSLSALVVPALFLLLLVPIPSVLLNALLYDMQMMTVWLAEQSLDLLGVASLVEGDLIRTAQGLFHVIESCAGFRIQVTLLMTVVLYAELFHLSRRRALALFLVTPLLSVFINNLRVLSIVFNPYSKFAAVHTLQGLAMIVLGVFAIALADAVLARVIRDEPVRRVRRPAGEWPVARIAALAGGFAALALAQWLTPPWSPPPASPAWTLSNLPLAHDGWSSESRNVDRDFLGSVAFTERSFRRFSKQAEWVDVFVGVDDHRRRSGSLISPKTRLPGTGFDVEEQGGAVDVGGVTVERLVVRSGKERQLVYHWRRGVLPVREEALREMFAIDRSRWRRDERSVVVRLATPIDARGRNAAEQRLTGFVPFVREGLAALDRAEAGTPAAPAAGLGATGAAR